MIVLLFTVTTAVAEPFFLFTIDLQIVNPFHIIPTVHNLNSQIAQSHIIMHTHFTGYGQQIKCVI